MKTHGSTSVTIRLAIASDLDTLTIHNYIPRERIARMGFEECGIIAGFNRGVGEVVFRKRLM